MSSSIRMGVELGQIVGPVLDGFLADVLAEAADGFGASALTRLERAAPEVVERIPLTPVERLVCLEHLFEPDLGGRGLGIGEGQVDQLGRFAAGLHTEGASEIHDVLGERGAGPVLATRGCSGRC